MIAKVERVSDSPDRRPDLRISDTDRDRAAEVLREAHAEGRISIDELDERLTSAVPWLRKPCRPRACTVQT